MAGNALVGLDIQGNLPVGFVNRQSAATAAVQANVQAGFAVISYKGRNFRIKYRGEEELVTDPMRPDVPSPYLNVIIVGAASAISKQYFGKQYTEGSDSAPDCFSLDGVKPDATAPQKQSAMCSTCPHNQWGSRITADGRRGKQCQDARRLAVVPAGDILNEAFDGPMLLRVPPMSLNNLALFGGALARRGIQIEAVVVRLSFDYSVAYPLLTFTPERIVNDEEARLLLGPNGNDGMIDHPAIHRILYDAIAEPGTGVDVDEVEPTPQTQTAPAPQPTPAPAAAPQPVQQPAATATQAPVTPSPAPAAAPAAPAVAVAPAPAPAPAAPARRRTAGFAGAVPAAAPAAAPALAPAPAPAPAPAAPAPNGAAGAAVPVAPANLQEAIDGLLA